MANLDKDCSFHATERTCDFTCFPCTFMHGLEGNGGKGGLWATTGVPKKYRGARLSNLPIQADNPKAYALAEKYVGNVLLYVQEKNAGLYLYSIPNQDNPLGTGTGKTTTAVTILNEYVIARSREYFTGRQAMDDNPAIFVKGTELQNLFNAQFRGSFQGKEEASIKYYRLKKLVKETELVVIDDIATRGQRISEAYEEELYEIIDWRASQVDNGATIFTSNINVAELSGILGERITSRIQGMTINVGFNGSDNRLDSLFK